jgi:hypothetical protein
MAKKLFFSSTDADTLAASDFVGAHLYAGGALVSATGGAIHIADGGGSITVDASDLDIRDLNSANDSVTVVATNLDIRDLAAATDSVSSWLKDGSGNSITSTTGYLDVNIAASTGTLTVSDAALANTALDNGEEDIVDTATKVIPTDLSARKYVFLYNHGNQFVYLGKQSGLATTNGFPFAPGVYLEARIGAAIALYGISPSGKTSNVRNLQFS